MLSPVHHLRGQFRAEQCCEQGRVWWPEGHLLFFWGFLSTKATEVLRYPGQDTHNISARQSLPLCKSSGKGHIQSQSEGHTWGGTDIELLAIL